MIRLRPLAFPIAGLILAGFACFRPVLTSGEQFSYRDAGHYYYPLHLKTLDQWRAGNIPLWDPSENSGMSLVGNPTAAVFYPGKLLFAALPFAWAVRLYAIGHVILAFAGTAWMLRRLGLSDAGTALGALSYAFGGPVLFQYSNAIYLVGSAWLPLGFLAADAWLRCGHTRG